MYREIGLQGQDWLFMLLMMTFMTVVTVVSVIAVVRAVRARKDAPDSALRLLDERYARGEITAEERRERREQLARR